MGSRERKRTQRAKRKARSAERQAASGASAGNGTGDAAARSPADAMTAQSEAKNRAAREALEPLAEGDRPTVVTVGAVISALIGLLSVAGYLLEVEVTEFGSDGIEQGQGRAPLASVLSVVVLMGVMAWGMWRARYWAVLGFQALLVLVLVGAALALVQTTDWLQAVWLTLLIAGAGAMFWFMVKAMARIQMPERPSRE